MSDEYEITHQSFYKAKVASVYDGDTITVDLDLGCNVFKHDEKIRLFGINTPEVRGDEREDGLVSRDWLRERILGKEIRLQTIKDKEGKYGRLLGIVVAVAGEPPLEQSINDQLVSEGLAKYVDY